MKRLFAIVISLSLVITLIGCGAKTRKDDFFSKEELARLYVNDLPEINYSSSYLKNYVDSLEGYFNVSKVDFINYTEAVLDYFKNTDYTYGGIVPGTTVSLAGAFPISDYMMYDQACLYEKEHNFFIFIYRPSGIDKEYKIQLEFGSFTEKGNHYNTKINICRSSIGSYIQKEDYLEIELTKEYIEEKELLNIHHKEYTFDAGINEFLYISLDIEAIIGKIEIDVETMYHGNRTRCDLTCYPCYPYSEQLYYFYDVIRPYEEGDLQILDYTIKSGVVVIKKILS